MHELNILALIPNSKNYTLIAVMEKETHLYGPDILRILAMYFVCVIHVGGCWGSISHAPDTINKLGALSIYSLSDVAVNLFMLITGYIGITHRWSWKGYAKIWAQVAFYSIAGILVSWWWTGELCSVTTLFRLLFPIPLANGYWYFTAYTGAFFLFPYANKLLQSINKREYQYLLAVLLSSICLFGMWHQSLWGGFNSVWMLVMYALGAYIRLHMKPMRQRYALGAYLLISAFTAVYTATQFYASKKYGTSWDISLFSHTSLATVAAAFFCFVFFVQLQIKGEVIRKLIRFAAPLTFAVYLIHEHPLLEHFFRKMADNLGTWDCYAMWHAPIVSALIYIICSSVDWFRLQLFKGIVYLAKRIHC